MYFLKLKPLVTLTFALFLSGCGGNSSTSGNPTDTSSGTPVQTEGEPIEADGLLVSPAVNGYYLSTETTTFSSGGIFRSRTYSVDTDTKTITRTDTGLGSSVSSYIVQEIYDDRGFVVSSKNTSIASGEVQTLDHEYAENGQLLSILNSSGGNSFYRYESGRLVKKEVLTNGSLFGEIDFYYDSAGRMEYTLLSSPLLTTSILKMYRYDVQNRLKRVEELDGIISRNVEEWVEFEYDDNGNVIFAREYSGDSSLDYTTRYEYMPIDGSVPNLVRQDHIYSIEAL